MPKILAGLGVLAPHACAGCGRRGAHLCLGCEAELSREHPSPGDLLLDSLDVRFAFAYGGTVRHVLHRAKYRDYRSALRRLCEIAALRLVGPGSRCAAMAQGVVGIPLGKARLRQRGYNQAGIWAETVAEVGGVPLLSGLRRCRDTPSQAKLRASQRAANVFGAFVAAGPLPPHVWLVDDVVTTGATLRAAANALRAAGVEKIEALTIAGVPAPRSHLA